jgi:hypothetical protein
VISDGLRAQRDRLKAVSEIPALSPISHEADASKPRLVGCTFHHLQDLRQNTSPLFRAAGRQIALETDALLIP